MVVPFSALLPAREGCKPEREPGGGLGVEAVVDVSAWLSFFDGRSVLDDDPRQAVAVSVEVDAYRPAWLSVPSVDASPVRRGCRRVTHPPRSRVAALPPRDSKMPVSLTLVVVGPLTVVEDDLGGEWRRRRGRWMSRPKNRTGISHHAADKAAADPRALEGNIGQTRSIHESHEDVNQLSRPP